MSGFFSPLTGYFPNKILKKTDHCAGHGTLLARQLSMPIRGWLQKNDHQKNGYDIYIALVQLVLGSTTMNLSFKTLSKNYEKNNLSKIFAQIKENRSFEV